MKRIGNLYHRIYSLENLELADKKARKNKKSRYGIIVFDRNRESNLLHLHNDLKNRTYKTSRYDVFKCVVDSGKEREIYRLPYYPDRITHHAIMNILEPIWMNVFTSDTYSCIKGRGIHGATRRIKRVLRTDPEGTRFCLKLDLRKFYPSIDHDTLKMVIRKKIKDDGLLWLLDEIIDSAPGLPIGNYLSQYMANLYLTYFDHWIKEVAGVRYYFRYCDDLVILHHDKAYLHRMLLDVRSFLLLNLKLTVKDNYQIFPVAARGIDFLGYRFFHTHTLLRKAIKIRFARKVKDKPGDIKTIHSAYWGWAKHCDSKNLIKKLSA